MFYRLRLKFLTDTLEADILFQIYKTKRDICTHTPVQIPLFIFMILSITIRRLTGTMVRTPVIQLSSV